MRLHLRITPRFAGLHFFDLDAVGRQAFDGLIEHIERFVMNRDHDLGLNELCGFGCEIDAHSKAIAAGDHRDVGLGDFANEFHVGKECGVATMVQGHPADGKNQAHGLAHVPAFVAGGMERGGKGDMPKVRLNAPAGVPWVDIIVTAFRSDVDTKLVGPDDRGIIRLGDRDGVVVEVVFVAMRERDVIALDVLGLMLRQGVAGEKGVDTDGFARVDIADQKSGMA